MTPNLATGQMFSSANVPTHKFSSGDDFLIDFQDNDLEIGDKMIPVFFARKQKRPLGVIQGQISHF